MTNRKRYKVTQTAYPLTDAAHEFGIETASKLYRWRWWAQFVARWLTGTSVSGFVAYVGTIREVEK